MKNFSNEFKQELRAAIVRAHAGGAIGEPLPEFFIPPNGNNVSTVAHVPQNNCVECSVIVNGLFRFDSYTLN